MMIANARSTFVPPSSSSVASNASNARERTKKRTRFLARLPTISNHPQSASRSGVEILISKFDNSRIRKRAAKETDAFHNS